jgi:flagellar hook assembly protein FlgD
LFLDNNIFDPGKTKLGMDVRVDAPGQVKVMIFNIAGEEVVKLLDAYESVGNYRVFWDGKNAKGETAGNAVYFVVIVQPSGKMTRQVIVLK